MVRLGREKLEMVNTSLLISWTPGNIHFKVQETAGRLAEPRAVQRLLQSGDEGAEGRVWPAS